MKIFGVFVLLVIFLCLPHGYCYIWTKLNKGIITNSTNSTNSSANNASFTHLVQYRGGGDFDLCKLDRLSGSWTTNHSVDQLLFAVYQHGKPDISVSYLDAPSVHKENDAAVEKQDGVIKCSINEDHCLVAVGDITAFTTPKNKIVLQFSHPTNTPSLLTSAALHRALSFSPPLVGGALGEWTSDQELEIYVEDEFMNIIFQYVRDGLSVKINTIRMPTYESITAKGGGTTTGAVMVRPQEIGTYSLFFVDAETRKIVSDTLIYHVRHCDSDSILPVASFSAAQSIFLDGDIEKTKDEDGVTTNTASFVSLLSALPSPALHIAGTIALTGTNEVKIPYDAVPAMVTGSWSMSFWIRLLEGGTIPGKAGNKLSLNSQMRCLFYKGHGRSGDPQRTPSAWLLPYKNTLTVRATTENNPDLGAETNIPVPVGDWNFLTFSFTNKTTSSEEEKGYQISVFINGVLDINMVFGETVHGNDGPLHMFKDNSHNGPVGFVKDIVIWNAPLDVANAEAVYRASAAENTVVEVDESIDAALTSLRYSELFRGQGLVATLTDDETSSLDNTPINEIKGEHDFDVDVLTNDINADVPWSAKTLVTASLTSKTPGAHGGQYVFDENTQLYTYKPHPDINHPMGEQLLQQGKQALLDCAPSAVRLDLYAEASEFGNIEALYMWALLIGFGSEGSQGGNCGMGSNERAKPDDNDDMKTSFSLHSQPFDIPPLLESSSSDSTKALVTDHTKALLALVIAAEYGHAAALVPLCTMILSGFGISALLGPGLDLKEVGIPLSPYILDQDMLHADSSFRVLLGQRLQEALNPAQSDVTEGVHLRNRNSYQRSLGTSVLCGTSLTRCVRRMRHSKGSLPASSVESDAMGDVKAGSHDPSADHVHRQEHTDGVTDIVMGLLHVASMFNVAEANVALSYRYTHGFGVKKNLETAAQYASQAVKVAADQYHKVGGQPILEADRIDDHTEGQIHVGNTGESDVNIQAQIIRASEGDEAAILAMGDLYYYGARGLARDQVLALQYYSQAHDLGNTVGSCGAAAMYLKGEGTKDNAKNVTMAIQLFESAAASGSVHALNGLGYIYFFGQELEKNETKAFYYFMEGAEYQSDSDALVNAAYCLENGVGVEKDSVKAAELYAVAAKNFGNFEAAKSLGLMYMQGEGVPRSVQTALNYLQPANAIGPWSGWIRRGLDHYLLHQFPQSLLAYVHGGELGYEISQSNAAYIIGTKLSQREKLYLLPSVDSGDGNSQLSQLSAMAFADALYGRQLSLSIHHGNTDNMVKLGDMYYKGGMGSYQHVSHDTQELSVSGVSSDPIVAVPQDYDAAVYWYSKASAAGHAVASVYLGYMHHFGLRNRHTLARKTNSGDRNDNHVVPGSASSKWLVEPNMQRANRYYKHALSSTPAATITPLPGSFRLVAQCLDWLSTPIIHHYTPSSDGDDGPSSLVSSVGYTAFHHASNWIKPKLNTLVSYTNQLWSTLVLFREENGQ